MNGALLSGVGAFTFYFVFQIFCLFKQIINSICRHTGQPSHVWRNPYAKMCSLDQNLLRFFHKTINMSDERKVKKGDRKWKIQRNTSDMDFISVSIVYHAALVTRPIGRFLL